MTNPCWDSQTDSIPERTHHFDEGHYSHSIHSKPTINAQEQPSKPSVDHDMAYLTRNARNGYNMQCDAIMGLWRDGVDYMKAVKWACYWLAKFNERSGVV